jgi:hypothetical protein
MISLTTQKAPTAVPPASLRTALFVTYTMGSPSVVGVFFRAIRLSLELVRRGWRCVICNRGPVPVDPKVDEARAICQIVSLDCQKGECDFAYALQLFKGVDPDVVLFGEYPLPAMEPLFQAARAVTSPPLLLLEQFYNPECISNRLGVDAFLLYGVRALWPEQAEKGRNFRIVPPFIERITSVERLPVSAPRDIPWITVLGFDETVLREGISILATLPIPAIVITVSHYPETAGRMLREAGIRLELCRALNLQQDSDLFGLIAASRAVILANGFMQIVEAIALGCPVVCVHRGVGMDGWSLHEKFRPYVSFEESRQVCVARLCRWIESCPLSSSLVAALEKERHGVTLCADAIEEAAAHPRLYSRLQRWGNRMRLQLDSGYRRRVCVSG